MIQARENCGKTSEVLERTDGSNLRSYIDL